MSNIEVLCEIAPGANIHPDAEIGRWCVIGPDVSIGSGATLTDRVTVIGNTTIGKNNRICSGSVIGGEPQDLKYCGGNTLLIIGDNNVIGRNVTINAGTEDGGWVTYIGSENTIGDSSHIAHDCYIFNRAKLGAKVLLAGHVVVNDSAVIEDMTGIHHFVRIGRGCLIGARTPVRRDIPAFTHYYSHDYYWDPPEVRGINTSAIAESISNETDQKLMMEFLEKLFLNRTGSISNRLDKLSADRQNYNNLPQVDRLIQFCRESLEGSFGRFREKYRGQIPPEAYECLNEQTIKSITDMDCLYKQNK